MSENIKDIVSDIINQPVHFVRLAGNSVILYLNCEPGDKEGFSVWLEPVWHLRSGSEVITGSREAQTEDAEEHAKISERLSVLIKKKIRKVKIEEITNDLHIELEDNYHIKTFVSDPNDEESWYIRNLSKDIKIFGNPKSIQEYKD